MELYLYGCQELAPNGWIPDNLIYPPDTSGTHFL